jgi:hypothetical protein
MKKICFEAYQSYMQAQGPNELFKLSSRGVKGLPLRTGLIAQ